MQISKEQLKYLLDWAFKFGKENVESKPVNQTLYSIKGLASDHPANKDFNKYKREKNK